jgi:hypothetical protein
MRRREVCCASALVRMVDTDKSTVGLRATSSCALPRMSPPARSITRGSKRTVEPAIHPNSAKRFSEPIGMIAGRVGDGVDRFDAGFLPRQWQYGLHGCNRRLMGLLIGGPGLAHLTVGQACAAPSREAWRPPQCPESRHPAADAMCQIRPCAIAAQSGAAPDDL